MKDVVNAIVFFPCAPQVSCAGHSHQWQNLLLLLQLFQHLLRPTLLLHWCGTASLHTETIPYTPTPALIIAYIFSGRGVQKMANDSKNHHHSTHTVYSSILASRWFSDDHNAAGCPQDSEFRTLSFRWMTVLVVRALARCLAWPGVSSMLSSVSLD